MKKVIGIISYLPDDVKIRSQRIQLLSSLIAKCNQLFNLSIFIIAQNWPILNFKNCTIFNYPKLGITGARKKLREKFLESEYDYLIMLDDDCRLEGSSGKEYLRQIDVNPGKFGEFKQTLLKLFAISKEIFELEDFEDAEPEKGEGFEDRILVNKLRKKYPDKKFTFKNTGITEISTSTKDPLSTWYNNQDIKTMLQNTSDIINKI